MLLSPKEEGENSIINSSHYVGLVAGQRTDSDRTKKLFKEWNSKVSKSQLLNYVGSIHGFVFSSSFELICLWAENIRI